MASTAAQNRVTPAITSNTLHSVVACSRPEVMTQVRSMVNQTAGVDVIAECSSGKEAIRACLQQKPDLLFIDTQIDGYSALEVAQALQTNAETRILFITGKSNWDATSFDVQIFEYNAAPLDESLAAEPFNGLRKIYQRRRRGFEGEYSLSAESLKDEEVIDAESGQKDRCAANCSCR